jgi:hypothetical protein
MQANTAAYYLFLLHDGIALRRASGEDSHAIAKGWIEGEAGKIAVLSRKAVLRILTAKRFRQDLIVDD